MLKKNPGANSLQTNKLCWKGMEIRLMLLISRSSLTHFEQLCKFNVQTYKYENCWYHCSLPITAIYFKAPHAVEIACCPVFLKVPRNMKFWIVNKQHPYGVIYKWGSISLWNTRQYSKHVMGIQMNNEDKATLFIWIKVHVCVWLW